MITCANYLSAFTTQDGFWSLICLVVLGLFFYVFEFVCLVVVLCMCVWLEFFVFFLFWGLFCFFPLVFCFCLWFVVIMLAGFFLLLLIPVYKWAVRLRSKSPRDKPCVSGQAAGGLMPTHLNSFLLSWLVPLTFLHTSFPHSSHLNTQAQHPRQLSEHLFAITLLS